MTTTFESMVDFLDTAYVLKDQIVPCLVGPVGIGKTEAVRKHAENVGANKVVEIIASQILPNEVSGITMPVESSKSMEIFDHFRLSSLEDGDILFFDELLEADQMVLSACLTLIESRTLMSGKKLPDIQIIAATNPTISPVTLKESIRNRFVFRNFNIDPRGCRQYIINDCGLDINLNFLEGVLESSSTEFNIMSQRSFTKMARWISKAETYEEAEKISSVINKCWLRNNIGEKLLDAWVRRNNSKDSITAKDAIIDIIDEWLDYDHIESSEDKFKLKQMQEERFMNSSFTEIMDVISHALSSEDLDIIFKAMSEKEIVVDDEEDM